jgi:hypothetical protein
MLSIQSGPAGASPTRFWPADRIARLTPEASYARLHREADLDKIGATLRAQEGEAHQTPDIAPSDAVTPGQLLERSGSAGG